MSLGLPPEQHTVTHPVQGDRDGTSRGGRVLDRVAHQVGADPVQLVMVTQGEHRPLGATTWIARLLVAGGDRVDVEHVLEDGVQVHRHGHHWRGGVVDRREEQVVDDAAEASRGAIHRGDGGEGRRGRGRDLLEHLEVPDDPR